MIGKVLLQHEKRDRDKERKDVQKTAQLLNEAASIMPVDTDCARNSRSACFFSTGPNTYALEKSEGRCGARDLGAASTSASGDGVDCACRVSCPMPGISSLSDESRDGISCLVRSKTRISQISVSPLSVSRRSHHWWRGSRNGDIERLKSLRHLFAAGRI